MNFKFLTILLVTCNSLCFGQQNSISVLHFEGVADKNISARTEVEDSFLELFNDFFEPGQSRRSAVYYSFNKEGNDHSFILGVDHHAKSNRSEIEDANFIVVDGIFSTQYNGAKTVKIKYVDKYISLPIGVKYTFKNGEKCNYYANCLIKPQLYYLSTVITKGYDASDSRVYFERASSTKEGNNEFHLTAEAGIGIEVMLSEKISLLGEINGDYSVINVLDADGFFKEHWYTGNLGVGLSYYLLK